YAGNNPSQVGYGVQVASIDKDMSMSSFQNTGRTLDLAIAGDGLFMCGSLDRNGQINSVTYTRMGNFGIDSVGNLVNANNEFVLGTMNTLRIDGGTYSTTEMIDKEPADTPNALDTINVNDLVWDAFKPECKIEFDDVAAKYKTADDTATPPRVQVIFTGTDPSDTTRQIAYDKDIGGIEKFTNNDVETPTPDPGVEVASDYILYSVNGKFVNSQGVIFDPDASSEANKPLYLDNDGNYYTYKCTTTKDDNGKVSKTYTYTRQTVTDEGGTRTFADSTEVYTYNQVNKNFEAQDARGNTIYADMTDGALKYSDLDGFTIGADGVLTAQYASEMRSLARIELATFDNVEGLTEIGDTAFAQSAASGEANIKRPGDSGAGEVQSSKLEMSNVNLANEFSDMIVTQRGYQANARIITTSDSMLEELVNLKR
ncbi:MAG: flagellar hook-basal body complex protein, partial [Oscillospiraceae bacterium]|nr:flagellar hook-basal body complex protein [Oscillospiraceae bacterium]